MYYKMNSPAKANKFMFFLFVNNIIIPIILSFCIVLIPTLKLYIFSPFIILLLSSTFTLILPIIFYLLISGQKISELIPLKKLSFINILLIFFMTIFIMPTINFLVSILNLFFENGVSNTLIELSNIPFWQMFLCVAILPAILEEIIFRGILLTNYKKAGIFIGALVTSIFFGIMHLDLYQFVYGTILGMVFSYFVYYSGTIFASMFSHFLINGSQVLLLYIAKAFPPEEATAIQFKKIIEECIFYLQSNLTIMIISLILFFILFFIFKKVNIQNTSDSFVIRPYFSYTEKTKVVTGYMLASILLFLVYILIDISL